jgi:pre-mRNA-splicing factor CDC5/CEF1
MKLAGIPATKDKRGKKKKVGIDYNKEIPFLRRPAPGFYEVDYESEDARAKDELSSTSIETMDGKRRSEEEQEHRKRDAKKMKTKEKQSLPDAMMQLNKINDPANIQSKLKLNLPAPQMTDEILEEMAKSESQMTDLTSQLDSDSAATKSLLPSFSPAPSATPGLGRGGATSSRFGTTASRTPMRTPTRTPAREDNITKEVQNLIALSQQQTPLIGGSNPNLHPSDFSGATPKPQVSRTPNPVLASATPGRSGQTPVRDFLNINSESQLEEQHKQKQFKSQLRSQLKNLPSPQNEYNVVLPEDTPSLDDEEKHEEKEVDMADYESYKQRQEKAVEMEKMRRRSAVLQKNLPRPTSVSAIKASISDKRESNDLLEADRLIRQEMLALIIQEAYEYPFEHSQISDPAPSSFSYYSSEQLAFAKSLISEELLKESRPLASKEAIAQIWSGCHHDTVYSSSQKRLIQMSSLDKKEQIEFYTQQMQDLKKEMTEKNEKAKKLDSKISVLQKGYQIRSNNLIQGIKNSFQELVQADIELSSFKKLEELENAEMEARLEYLNAEVSVLEEREAKNQQLYQELLENKAKVH